MVQSSQETQKCRIKTSMCQANYAPKQLRLVALLHRNQRVHLEVGVIARARVRVASPLPRDLLLLRGQRLEHLLLPARQSQSNIAQHLSP